MTVPLTGRDTRFREAAELLEAGPRDGAYTAAVLLVGQGEEVVWERSAGFARTASAFDIASVTKPLAAALFFALCQEGHLSLDAPVSGILPFSSPDPRVGEIRFLHLLAHTSGLPAYLPLYEKVREAEQRDGRPIFGAAEGHDLVVAEILSLPLAYPPGSAWEYSDLGYILLGRAIEAAGFQSLDRLMEAKLTGPLGMRDTGYLPLCRLGDCETGQIVPTGWSEVRQREKAGEVDDENAAAMGGVAGHAGIFSTARDLFLFAREVLRARKGEGRVLSGPSALALTSRVAVPRGCPRTAGFDTPTAGSQAGETAPPDAFGHLGYTGCSLWVDPRAETVVVFLTNRVVHGTDNRKLSALRPRIHDAVWRGIPA
ncbi:MAG: serine hydrolase domain-containing protein [Verrucomicrobiota bacterium]